jgi:hypothetical protein
MNSNGGLASQMVEKEIAQFKITEINLIANEIKLIVSQEFFSGKPGIIAAGTFFKHRHVYTISSCNRARST